MRSVLLGLACVLVAAGIAVAEGEKCCLTNPAFTGVCEQTPAKDETCQSILDYLNKPNSAGKDYCDNTNVRGGWKLTSCESRPQGQGALRDSRALSVATSSSASVGEISLARR